MSFRRLINGTRYSPGLHVRGEWQDPAPQPIQILATVQPAQGRDIELLPEGRREGRIFAIFTDEPLNPNGEDANPDVFVLDDGLEYEVLNVAPWQNGLIPHFRGVAVKKVAPDA